MTTPLILGLDTFGDVTVDLDGTPLSTAQVLRNTVEQGVLTDRVGVDAFGVGEHHRDDFAVSAPDVLLAAIAARTERLVLGTAVTVLSSDDPVRVYERFATLGALSSGRAEVTLGRGSEGPVSWEGTVRRPLVDADVFPKTEHGRLAAWVGVGGSPESVVRAARYGFGLALAIIGGEPARFAPYTDLFRRALAELGQEPQPILVHSPGFVADTDEEARELLFPHFKANRDRIGSERGWPPATRPEFDREVATGSLYVGSPETVAQKIATTARTLGIDRFDLKYANGTMPHEHLMRCVELYGTRVAPRVRDLLAD